MFSSYSLPGSDFLTSLKTHECEFCEKCSVCHDCVLALGYLRSSEVPEVKNDTLDVVTFQNVEESPRYLFVGPNNEIEEIRPEVVNVEPIKTPETCSKETIEVFDTESTQEPVELFMETKEIYDPDSIKVPVESEAEPTNFEEEHQEPDDIVQPDSLDFITKEELPNLEPAEIVLEQVYECEECDKTFTTAHDLDLHKIYHSVEKQHTCKICDKTFKFSYQLIRHALYHGRKSHICKHCKVGFASEEKLHIHMRVHTGDKPFVCSFCEKRFKENFLLKNHLRSHSDERPFVCGVCGRSFKEKLKLKQHNMIHAGIKPFSCLVCEKTFRHKCNLKSHCLNHHNVALN